MAFRWSGFTLIELLIVVAIISILAAIAIPNFLEAQVRAKVARSKAEMRTIATAVEVMRSDLEVMLIDFWDDDHPEAWERCAKVFGGTCFRDQRGGTMGVLVPLTTPIAYISSLPTDPFTIKEAVFPGLVPSDQYPPWTYIYIDEDPDIPGQDAGFYQFVGRYGIMLELKETHYILIGSGPDRVYQRTPYHLYDPSNGTISLGDIVYSSRTTFSGEEL